MKPLPIPALVVIWIVAAVLGAQIMDALASRGHSLPIAGWLSTAVLLAVCALLLVLGIPLRRYMLESEAREQSPTAAPRRHDLDLPTAFRTILLARACGYTGAIFGGIFAGQALHLLLTGTGDPLTGVLPTASAALSGTALGVLGVIVERWGKLPPGGDGSEEPEEAGG